MAKKSKKPAISAGEFFAGFGIGEEIKSTNKFLRMLIIKFIDMIRLFYRTIKKYVLNGILKLWPLYLSLFMTAIVISLFLKQSKTKIVFVCYLGVLFITFLVFFGLFRLLELLISLIVKVIKNVKKMKKSNTNQKVEIGFKSFGLIIGIVVIVGLIAAFCYCIKYCNDASSSMYNFIHESAE